MSGKPDYMAGLAKALRTLYLLHHTLSKANSIKTKKLLYLSSLVEVNLLFTCVETSLTEDIVQLDNT